uniref:Uncharacterized protein n=1 Tax=Liagoropsis maxima TaxID=1653392 RepID=A0A1G4NW55_9FLOR|nr:Hypothetical protein ORF_2 [Liagoropsis maxima]SCW22746.1 Hypothetical protein ORF_2 [Liagoropsis maxima]
MSFTLYLHTSTNILNYKPVQSFNYFEVLNLSNSAFGLKFKKSYTSSSHDFLNHKLFVATESVYRFSKLQDSNSNLFQELLDKYWKQTIFLSNTNSVVRKYSGLVAKQEGSLVKNKKKKFIVNFTKALQNGYIDCDQVKTTSLGSLNQLSSIRYVWNKKFNIKTPKYLDGLWQNKRCPSFPNQLQSRLLQKLQHNNCPTFIVVNGFNQIVLAEPANQLVLKNDLLNSIYQWYHDRFLWLNKDNALYEGWFFINPNDAKEYENFIRFKYPRSSNQNGLNVLSSNIQAYYRLNRLAPPRTEFRLFPDLEEVGKLVSVRGYRNGLVFDKQQKYGKNYFQGQPIYFIEPMHCSMKNSKTIQQVNYYYTIPGDEPSNKYTAIFFNKDIAMQAWKHFKDNMSDYKLPKQPKLRVYNLEDFLKDNEQQVDLVNRNFLFIPGKEAYTEIQNKSSDENLYLDSHRKQLATYKLTLKLWAQRIVWSLTSRQPPNW